MAEGFGEHTVIVTPDQEQLCPFAERCKPDCTCAARLLQDFVKITNAPFKYPRALDFVDSLPKTEAGKIQRFKLRQV